MYLSRINREFRVSLLLQPVFFGSLATHYNQEKSSTLFPAELFLTILWHVGVTDYNQANL